LPESKVTISLLKLLDLPYFMGRIRTGFVKRQAEGVLQANKDKFTTKFEDNKKALMELADFPTKKLRNLIAGYITKELKKEQVAA
jgi:small subunit ribosomal protein S17e